MHPDDESQTTLSKWPFILGDVLLVATALAIAILGHWQLTDWQVGACVAAVALGAALFVLPYVVEYQVRVREEMEDRAADLRLLEKHIVVVEQAIDSVDARIRALESAAASADDPNAALAEAMDQKTAQLEAARVAQEKAIQALQKNFEELAAKEPPPAFDPEVLKAIEKRLKALEDKPAPAPVEAAAPKIETPAPTPKVEAPASPAPEPEKPEQQAPKPEPKTEKPEKPKPPEPETKATPIERPQREARERHGPEESRLLKRAISEKGDKSSTAVSRIIGSKNEEPKPEEKAEPEEKAKPEPKPAKEEASKVEQEPESRDDAIDLDAEVPAMDSADMLFDDAAVSSPIKKTQAKKNDAVVTASVFIGIGNKPYLRGSGAGLSWEKGVLMEFQEIGKWRWVAPSDLEAPVELQIYRNDEDPDKSGKCTLEPGQKLEVTPVF